MASLLGSGPNTSRGVAAPETVRARGAGEVTMQTQLRHEPSTADLMREVIDEAKELVTIEIALARDEARREIDAVKASAIALGAAAAAALLGLALVLVAVALAIDVGWLPPLVIGLLLLVGAAIAGLVGYRGVPRRPLPDTRRRIGTDVRLLKERAA